MSDKDQVIANLQSLVEAQGERLEVAEKALESTNDALLNLQRTIVELTASHIDRIFTDPVMVDSLAQRFMIAAANAIAHKARHSKERTPELVVIESAIPGAIKVTLLEDGGVKVEEQLVETGEWVTGDDLSETMKSDTIQEVFGSLLASYGASLGRPYYVVEDVHLETFRKETAAAARQATAQVQGAAKPVIEEAPAEEASAPVTH